MSADDAPRALRPEFAVREEGCSNCGNAPLVARVPSTSNPNEIESVWIRCSECGSDNNPTTDFDMAGGGRDE